MFHVLLGDVPWDDMQKVGRVAALIWFVTFIWLLELVMFNMLLAIIMDVYAATRSSLGEHAETLWSQSWELYTRWRDVKQGRGMPLEHIIACLVSDVTETGSEKEANRVFTLKTFMNRVPGIIEPQAIRILEGAAELEASKKECLSMTDAVQHIGHINNRLASIIRMVDFFQTYVVQRLGQDPEQTQQKDVAEQMSQPVPFQQTQQKDVAEKMSQPLPQSFAEQFNRMESCADRMEGQMVAMAQGQQRLLYLQSQEQHLI